MGRLRKTIEQLKASGTFRPSRHLNRDKTRAADPVSAPAERVFPRGSLAWLLGMAKVPFDPADFDDSGRRRRHA